MASQPEPGKKAELRVFWKKVRRRIPKHRQEEALRASQEALIKRAKGHRYVLSYASFAEEFSTETINRRLQSEGKLVLPKVVGEHLHLYLVQDLGTQLKNHPHGFGEPIPALCQEVDVSEVTLVIVPGIAFDQEGHRLGYGKGYYDRFLRTLPESVEAYGLGYKEQYVKTPLPSTPLDHPLHGLLLF